MNIEVDFVSSSKDNDQPIDNFVNVYAITDQRMQELGQVLRTPKSRKIYQILMDKELHTKQIGVIIDNEPNPRLPNLTHHLKKMTKIGMLTSTSRMKNGHYLTYYKSVNYLLIVPDKDEKVGQKSKTLRNTMKKVFKITSIGIATLSSYLMLHNPSSGSDDAGTFFIEIHHEFIIPPLVLAGGIGLERLINFFNKRHSINIE